MSTPKPAPRVWWDGHDLLVLRPDGEDMPGVSRVRRLADVQLSELPNTELKPDLSDPWDNWACDVSPHPDEVPCPACVATTAPLYLTVGQKVAEAEGEDFEALSMREQLAYGHQAMVYIEAWQALRAAGGAR